MTLTAVAGCSAHHPPHHAPGRPHPAGRLPRPAGPLPDGVPDPRTVDVTDPSALSRAAAITLWSIDAATDHHGQHDADLRLAPYLVPAYARQLTAADDPAPLPDEWIRRHLHTLVRAQPGYEDAPADSPTRAYRQWRLTITTLDRHGHRQAPPQHIVEYLTLVRSAHTPWRISAMTPPN